MVCAFYLTLLKKDIITYVIVRCQLCYMNHLIHNVVSSTIYWLFLPGNSSKSGSEEIQEKRWRHKVPEPKEELVDVPKT